jgi:hypothetical protein
MSDYGVLAIDWGARRFSLTGITGESEPPMTPKEVHARLVAPHEPETEVWAVVVFDECSGGTLQLCLYRLEDFEQNVYRPRRKAGSAPPAPVAAPLPDPYLAAGISIGAEAVEILQSQGIVLAWRGSPR